MRTSQIFKTNIPKSLLNGFLSQICSVKDNYYIFTYISYKKAKFKNIITGFIDKVSECYYNSKKFYVEREMNYKNLMTVIRQICKNNSIDIHSETSYESSSYTMTYFIDYIALQT